jgi:hypothetical protein
MLKILRGLLSMSVSLPSATVAIIKLGFNLVAAVFAHKNPRFSFLNLNTEKRGFFYFAKGANFSFHIKLIFFVRSSLSSYLDKYAAFIKPICPP